jgi:hypothetical protein
MRPLVQVALKRIDDFVVGQNGQLGLLKGKTEVHEAGSRPEN